jgi:hypothetical protein
MTRPHGRQSARQRQVAGVLLDGPLDTAAIQSACGAPMTASGRVTILETLRLMRERGRLTSTGTRMLTWALTPRYEAQIRAVGTARRAPHLARVLRVIGESPLPATVDEIASTLDMGEDMVRSMLAAAVREPPLAHRVGTIVRGHGHPSVCWQLTEMGAQSIHDGAILASRIV